MNKIKEAFGAIGSILSYIIFTTIGIVHIVAFIIVIKENTILVGVLTLLFPIIAEIYWGINFIVSGSHVVIGYILIAPFAISLVIYVGAFLVSLVSSARRNTSYNKADELSEKFRTKEASAIPYEAVRETHSKDKKFEILNEEAEKQNKLYGLGGWLVLFQIRLILSIILSVYYMFLYPWGNAPIYFTLIFLAHFTFMCSTIVMFYRKKIIFRLHYIIAVGFSFISLAVLFNYGIDIFEASGDILYSILWIIYLFVSKRVKYNFLLKSNEPTNKIEPTFEKIQDKPIEGEDIQTQSDNAIISSHSHEELSKTNSLESEQPYITEANKNKKEKKRKRFCRYCGGKVDIITKKCASCGKQYFRFPKKAFKILILLFLLVALVGLNVYQYILLKTQASDILDLSLDNSRLKQRNEYYKTEVSRLEEEISTYRTNQDSFDTICDFFFGKYGSIGNSSNSFNSSRSVIIIDKSQMYHTSFILTTNFNDDSTIGLKLSGRSASVEFTETNWQDTTQMRELYQLLCK